ncbi:MAG TPA: tRNA (adenosine(37)-N6)-threonylcarbamoyltransferase complex dimerization subunit type 1 TsaB [Bacteroidales bacterium]|nr:tRNA (adenosine(37)-N6)-threonylcarbamoyltransferase complex dimerization subunit type 1 TsaB [Bacteroidales bacterium]
MILCLETATNVCSVALCNNEGTEMVKESSEPKSHASTLTVLINEILVEYGIRPSELEAIAVSKGPGSYTGLRIGVSVAKGICFASGVPLIGIETPTAMFHGFISARRSSLPDPCRVYYSPMIDARRMEVYYAIYDCKGNKIKDISAGILNSDIFAGVTGHHQVIAFGDGSFKLKNLLPTADVSVADDFRMSAAHLQIPAAEALKSGKFEDVAYFEPFYLKDFIATKQVKNILGK